MLGRKSYVAHAINGISPCGKNLKTLLSSLLRALII